MSTPLIEFGRPAAGPASEAVPAARVKLPRPPTRLRTVVSVNGVEIPHAAISAEAQQHPSASAADAYRTAAEALVVRELLLAEARAQDVSAAPERDGKGRLETDDDALVRALLENRIETPVATDAECRRYYDTHPEILRSQDISEASHILIHVPPGAEPAEVARLEALAGQVIGELADDPARFAELAKTHSACPSRENGGSLGQVTPGSTVPEFERGLAALGEGELSSEPVRSRYGFHIIKLHRRTLGRRLPFEVARDRIALHLQAASWSRAVSQFIGVLADRADIQGVTLHGDPHQSGGLG